MAEWNIEKANIPVIIMDNAPNILKGMRALGVVNESCFFHNLKLVIFDGIFSQRAVKDLITICRKIVGHINHSALATTNSMKSKSQKLPVHKFIQDTEILYATKDL